MHLTREQIAAIVERVGQPEASVLLNGFFQSYCRQLDSADVASLYDDEYAKRIASHPVRVRVDERYPVNAYNHYTYSHLLKAPGGMRRVLDFGCGDGSFAMAVAVSLGCEVLGIDFNAELIDMANKRATDAGLSCHFSAGSLEAVSGQGLFDAVTLNDVVEHLSDRELRVLFRGLYEHLEDRGELVIHTPNGLALCNDTETSLLQWIYKAYIRLLRGWRGFERTIDQMYYDQVHINIKSYASLARLLSECGYQSEVIYDSQQSIKAMSFLSPNMLVIARKNAHGW